MAFVLVRFCQLDISSSHVGSRNLREAGTSVEKIYPPSLWSVFLVNDYCGRAQIPGGQAVLESMKKQDNQARRNKPGNSLPPWPLL